MRFGRFRSNPNGLFILQLQPLHELDQLNRLHAAMNIFYSELINRVGVKPDNLKAEKFFAVKIQNLWMRARALMQLGEERFQVCSSCCLRVGFQVQLRLTFDLSS